MSVQALLFGEGVFMRAFIGPMLSRAGLGAAAVSPRGNAAAIAAINAAGGRYAVLARGIENGRLVERAQEVRCLRRCLHPTADWAEISALARSPELRFVFSNTTEAGIEHRAGVDTFPAKVARLISVRAAAGLPGLDFIPCELIARNGAALRECVMAHCNDAGDERAAEYAARRCRFSDTLVDRIVPGAPPEGEAEEIYARLGRRDPLLVCAEPFSLFAVDAPERAALECFAPDMLFTDAAGLSALRERKVRFLNGAHTACVHAALLAGHETVGGMLRDAWFADFLRRVLHDEISPALAQPEAEKRAYAESVLERLANPFAHHRLQSIAMNSVAKWRVRVLPTMLDFHRLRGFWPPLLCRAFAAMAEFLTTRDFEDAPEVRAFFQARPAMPEILSNKGLWGMELPLEILGAR